ncbi:flagellar motor protein MotA [Pseudoalteromonas sp. A25]|uniref:MotA/TolQ/ExbB proton channel family protein n=1 Tax=Pseudoalteromonas sp. A25 TaxID=116092 RepID=UPI001260BF3D|nr:MotA/TolQ/ExbB proton channel family protein [Pseudoalteromonas sp. A25]BBN82523.1 flagellar motor protein MotA [Pseudoalteromonas sp. A25]
MRIFTLTAFLLLGLNVHAQSAALIERVSESKIALSKLQASINNQSLQYQKKLEQSLREVEALRAQAESIQRASDEKVISYERLSERVRRWREQDNYQKMVMQSFFEQQSISLSDYQNSNGVFSLSSSMFNTLKLELVNKLSPNWQEKPVVNAEGEVVDFRVLKIGPLELAYNSELEQGGLLTKKVNQTLPKIIPNIYSAAQIESLATFADTGSGFVTFDPTLGNAEKLLHKQDSIISHIQKGGVWALPILLFGFVALVATLTKGYQLFRLPKPSHDFIEKIKQTDINSLQMSVHFKGAEKALLDIAVNNPVSEYRDDQLVAFLMQYRYRVESYLGVVATSAAIAPLLGLLGTVSGMINTFMMMNTFGTGDAATVSGGISEALVTTELGLIVAIPSLIMSALLNRKAKSLNSKLEANAIQLSKLELKSC